jgi:hypothetical protein
MLQSFGNNNFSIAFLLLPYDIHELQSDSQDRGPRVSFDANRLRGSTTYQVHCPHEIALILLTDDEEFMCYIRSIYMSLSLCSH